MDANEVEESFFAPGDAKVSKSDKVFFSIVFLLRSLSKKFKFCIFLCYAWLTLLH